MQGLVAFSAHQRLARAEISRPRSRSSITSLCLISPLFMQRLVEKKRWMSEQLFMELFALGGCLPGPTSTQVSFAMGTVKKGVLGESGKEWVGSRKGKAVVGCGAEGGDGGEGSGSTEGRVQRASFSNL